MKTTNQNSNSRLKNRAEQQVSTNSEGAAAAGASTENLLPVDAGQRKQNRKLPAFKVLNLLGAQLPDVYRLAEVVGKWVWVQFQEVPAAEIRQQLSQLGFHWNRQRQAWQHPCGVFSLHSVTDPHGKYRSYFAADVKPN
jgi:hypothetical protein